MAEPLPAALKIPEVSRFINRANQLRSIKPAIAYWCEYHAVNQIVGKGLHTADDETFNFTKTLLERLEETKNERADDDAINDNTAGQAYVEQFAQQTFDRAERTLIANKVTRQTADTFDAAATFFDLTHEWGTPEPDVLQKIKFAKWNAARILKAIRQGEDPNDSNPKREEPEEAPPALDPNDPDVQEIQGTRSYPVSVEDVSDAGEPSGPPAFTDQPPHPPADQGYFPSDPRTPETFIPSPMSQSPTPAVSGMPLPPTETAGTSTPQYPPQPPPQFPIQPPQQFHPSAPPAPSPRPDLSSPPSWSATPSAVYPPPQAIPQQPTPRYVAPPLVSNAPVSNMGGFTEDARNINQAQKHAKWAISALNFEDVPTAVKELRSALATLGAL
ncbi:hypothetical protein G7046_g9195 [Stylonectria norvegica]|nr:hypothetical protein G7046_g9195 [Stylonectria norvegica]